MSIDDVLALLRLPADAVLRRRVAKSDFAAELVKPADRRLVADRVGALHWHAALNPANTGLAPDGTPGLAVVTLATRGTTPTPPPRLLALVHRAVPDPLLLVTAHTNHATTVGVKPALGEPLTAALTGDLPEPARALLAVDRAGSLADLHGRWCQAVLGLVAHAATGTFPPPAADLPRRRATLERVIALDATIRKLVAAARRERQAPRRAELNRQLQDARRRRTEAADSL